MVATVGSIRVLLAAEYGTYQDGLRRAASTTERESQRMGRSIQNVDRSTSALSRTMAGIRGREFRVLSLAALRAKDSVERLRGTLLATAALFGGFGAAFTLKGISEYADTYTKVGNRLRVVKGEAQELSDIEEKIFQTAQRSRAQYEATGVLFARIATSARRLGVAQADVLRVTETIQKAFVIGGSTPIEAAQSSIQLSQGIASNRLQGDELRSVLENPALGQLLADRITEGDIGKLRKIASEGQLTAGVVIRAFKGASEEIDRLFAGAQQTIAESFVKIDNAILKYIGTSENANKASRATVAAMNAIAENFESIGDAAVMAAVAFGAVLLGKGIGAVTDAARTSLAATRAWKAETIAAAQSDLEAAKMQVAASRDRSIAAAQNARAARQMVVDTSRGRRDEIAGIRAGMVKENIDAEMEKAKKATESIAAQTDIRKKSLREMVDAQNASRAAQERLNAVTADASTTISKMNREQIASASAAYQNARNQRVSAQAYYEMAKASTVSEKTRIRAGQTLQANMKKEQEALAALSKAHERAATPVSMGVEQSRQYQKAKRDVVRAAAAEIKAVDSYIAAEAKSVALTKQAAAARARIIEISRNESLTDKQRLALKKAEIDIDERVAAAKKRSASARVAADSAYAASRQATTALTQAQNGLNAAISQTSTASILATKTIRGLGSVMNFLGGPLGVLSLIATTVFIGFTKHAAAAEERLEGLKKAGTALSNTMAELESMAPAVEGIDRLAVGFKKLFSEQGFSAAQAKLNELRTAIYNVGLQLGELARQIAERSGSAALGVEITMLTSKFKVGSLSVDQFVQRLEEIARADPELAAITAEMIRLARETYKATSAAEKLVTVLDRIKGEDFIMNVRVGDLRSALQLQAMQIVRGSQEYQDALAAAGEGMTKATEDWREAREDAVKEAFKQNRLDPIMARMYGDVLEGVNQNRGRTGKTESEKAAEKLKKALADLDYQILASELPELERKTIEAAQSAGVAEEDIRAFISALKSGENIPPALDSIRDRLEQIAEIEVNKKLDEARWDQAVRFMSDLDQATVEMARSAGMAEEKVRGFIQAVSAGELEAAPQEMAALRMEMERIAMNDRIIDLADGMAGAFGDFFRDAGRGADSFGTQLRNLGVRLIEVAQEVLIVTPLVNALKNIFLGGFGGNTLPPIQLGLPVAHSGWNVGEGTPPARRTVPVSALANAQRFHDGLAPDEFAAILQQGEAVIPKSAVRSATRAVGAAASGAPMEVGVRVYVDDEGALRAMVDRRTGERIGEYAQGSYNRHIQNQNRAKRTRALR